MLKRRIVHVKVEDIGYREKDGPYVPYVFVLACAHSYWSREPVEVGEWKPCAACSQGLLYRRLGRWVLACVKQLGRWLVRDCW